MNALATLVAPVSAIARAAGQAIMEHYAGRVVVERKADDSPLTAADLDAHRAIVAGLRDLTPDVPVLSEESSGIGTAQRRRWREYWLVDPLDGTKEFLSRNGEFTVNIALVRDHSPVLGIVHAPALAVPRTYAGSEGAGATRADGAGAPRPIRVASAPAILRVVGSRSHRGASLDAFLARLGPHELVAMGSSLKFCLVAEGAADVYPRFGPTSEWDTAAAQAVVEAAGGVVLAPDRAPLRYNARDDLLNPSFIASADATRDWWALA